MRTRAPYGTWPSAISAIEVAQGANRPGDVVVDGADVYLGESRPAEAGRGAILKHRLRLGGGAEDVLPRQYSARSRVHEYGGGAFTVRTGALAFVNDEDQALYFQGPGERPRRVSPLAGGGQRRFAQPVIDAGRERIVAVMEEHAPAQSGQESPPPHNSIVAIGYGSRTGRLETLATGHDFYASIRLSPDGRRLAWLSWRHPQMPWDGTELWLAELDGRGLPAGVRRIAGSDSVSIFQPEWDQRGGLIFVSDESGYWNLQRWDLGRIKPLCPRPAEFGLPQWVFGMSTYCVLPDGDLLCALTESGSWRLGRLSQTTGALRVLEHPFTEFSGLRASPNGAALLAASPNQPPTLMHFDIETEELAALQDPPEGADDPAASREQWYSQPHPIEFPTGSGQVAHGLYYAPTHPDHQGPEGERPPLLVRCHGGPTAQASTALSLRTQFWTSRGFALLEVNYRGSTGYGRAYRQALQGQWGLSEVDDCIAGAQFLVQRGLVDRQRLCISGGSAGGYTSLAALTFHDVFAAGAIYYGVSDLSALALDTHKFEARYLDGLVGPYPEAKAVYDARSPLMHRERLKKPVAFFHGLKDKVTPPNQATEMVNALRESGIPVAFVQFPNEGHGFRQAETIRRTLEGEFYFYCRVLGIPHDDSLPPLDIENLA